MVVRECVCVREREREGEREEVKVCVCVHVGAHSRLCACMRTYSNEIIIKSVTTMTSATFFCEIV